MPAAGPRKFVLDTNCFVDASRADAEAAAFTEFCAWAAPGLYLSTVVAAELRAGAGAPKNAARWSDRSCPPMYVVVDW